MAILNLEQSYLTLPAPFYHRTAPNLYFNGPLNTRFSSSHPNAPQVIFFNNVLSKQLNLSTEESPSIEMLEQLAGKNTTGLDTIAQAYAGHQFGHLNMLGDGRAVLLGEAVLPEIDESITLQPAKRFDIQLKGAGQTAFSRGGDGRAALGPMLREYLISEAMFALGIPTTRSLAVFQTGETVLRESPHKGAVLTRVASSHIRVGTFVYAAHLPDISHLRQLADYVIARHYPELANLPNQYLLLLKAVIARQAKLVAKWQAVGFVHGVMNTDNMSISGETIDYGPCAFLDTYSENTVFSSIDKQGRYAYGRQPDIAKWNLARFAESLLPLIAKEESYAGVDKARQEKAVVAATKVLDTFMPIFEQAWLEEFAKKIGFNLALGPTFSAKDLKEIQMLIRKLLELMEVHQADFTVTFTDLTRLIVKSLVIPLEMIDVLKQESIFSQKDLYTAPAFESWLAEWTGLLARKNIKNAQELMRQHNPVYIPRNFRVEEALFAATQRHDFSQFNRLLSAIKQPHVYSTDYLDLARPPSDGGIGFKTFCGT